MIHRLYGYLPAVERGKLFLLLILMVVTSFAEVLSIGAVIPFLGVLISPQSIYDQHFMQPLIHALSIATPQKLLPILTAFFCISTLIAAALRLFFLRFLITLSFAIGSNISYQIYEHTLYQPYITHVGRNSSEVIDAILGKSYVAINGIIVPALTLINNAIVAIIMIGALFFIKPLAATSTVIIFLALYLLIGSFSRKFLSLNGSQISQESPLVIKSLQEGLGGIRDVILGGTQKIYTAIYRKSESRLRKAQASNLYMGQSPRYVVEAFSIILLALLAFYFIDTTSGVLALVPILGALALGAQRLLPIFQQGYSSWASIRGNQSVLGDVLSMLEQPSGIKHDLTNASVSFDRNILLKNVYFQYEKNLPWVLRDINLEFVKGDCIGIVGKTGSGKSTFLDVCIGLLSPTTGELFVDGLLIDGNNSRSWQSHIAHVPQTIYLSDCSIEENIAFGIPVNEIDYERIKFVAKKAQISEKIETLQFGYQTLVGENGVRLSGGERQRIGIARALYKKADVIIFDEATSALDNQTEKSVMDTLYMLGDEITIFIIAHRLTTLKSCSQIIELEHGEVKRVGSYQEIISKSSM